eukprot:4954778-Lingulodinium_polyedra.AAC.1
MNKHARRVLRAGSGPGGRGRRCGGADAAWYLPQHGQRRGGALRRALLVAARAGLDKAAPR